MEEEEGDSSLVVRAQKDGRRLASSMKDLF